MIELFYPLTIAALAAGFIAFIMLVLKFDMLIVSTIVIWFYFLCASSIYLISREVLKLTNAKKLFLAIVISIGTFAGLSTLILILQYLH
jgi:hypothetical protein